MMRICDVCGVEFPIDWPRNHAKRCSPECVVEAERRGDWLLRHPGATVAPPRVPRREYKCSVCGVSMPASVARDRRTCGPECQAEAKSLAGIKGSAVANGTPGRRLRCAVCGQRFEASKAAGRRRKYCSRECYKLAMNGPGAEAFERACDICGQSYLANPRAVRRVCSDECAGERKRRRSRAEKGRARQRRAMEPVRAIDLHDGDCSQSCRLCRLNEGEAIDDNTPSCCTKYLAQCYGEMTLEQIGDAWNLSRERIRQIEAAALAKMERRAPAALRELLEPDHEHGARLPRMERWKASEQAYWTTPMSQFSVRREAD